MINFGFKQAISLPSLGASTDLATVSGLSSGGYMAVQLHVIYSNLFKGAGIVAGGPYYCAEDNLGIAMSSCMKNPFMISLPILEAFTKTTATK